MDNRRIDVAFFLIDRELNMFYIFNTYRAAWSVWRVYAEHKGLSLGL